MDDERLCTHCGAPLERGDTACPECGAGCEEEVIEVEATPIDADRGVEVWQDPFDAPEAPEIHVRRFEVRRHDGGGCCFAGCLVAGFLLFLLYRGIASLF